MLQRNSRKDRFQEIYAELNNLTSPVMIREKQAAQKRIEVLLLTRTQFDKPAVHNPVPNSLWDLYEE